MTSVAATTWSSLQAIYLESLYAREKVLLGTSNEASYSRSSISLLMIAKRKSKIKCD